MIWRLICLEHREMQSMSRRSACWKVRKAERLYIEELAEIPEDIQGDLLTVLRDGCCVMKEGYLQKLNIRMIAGSKYSVQQLEQMTSVNNLLLQQFSLFPWRCFRCGNAGRTSFRYLISS